MWALFYYLLLIYFPDDLLVADENIRHEQVHPDGRQRGPRRLLRTPECGQVTFLAKPV